MDQQHVSEERDQAHICEKCGGSGQEYEVYGPFYALVPQEQRKVYREHLAARHEAMKYVDRILARRFKHLQKLTITDVIESLGAHVLGAEEGWHDGDLTAVRANVLELAAAAIWILEADGAGYITE